MEPENLRFGGGLSHTVFSPVVALMVVVAVLFICFAPRNKAIVAFLAGAIMIPMDQVLVIGSLHFPVLRILIIFGLIRMFLAKFTSGDKIFSCGMNGIDKAVILLTVVTAINGILLWGSIPEVIFQFGNLYSVLGTYFLLRFLIRDETDVLRTFRIFAYMLAIISVFMAYERITGTNLIYGLLGGARSVQFATAIQRDKEFRAMGPFGHPILAGTFGAILVPLFVSLWWKGKQYHKVTVIGVLASTVASVAGNSSTSLLGYGAGIAALCMWPLRGMLRAIRWGIVLTLISLHLYMKSPVWHLIDDIDLVGGSSSYHRYQLVNQCILHFSNWWLIGTKSYADWGWDMWDLSNQYVAIAVTAGLIPLLCFLTIIVLGFKYLGKARKAVEGDRPQELFFWAIGSAMFANVVAYFGTSYWDQTIVAWYAYLAIIPVVVATAAVKVPQAEPPVSAATARRPALAFRRNLAPGSARGRLSS